MQITNFLCFYDIISGNSCGVQVNLNGTTAYQANGHKSPRKPIWALATFFLILIEK